MDTRRPLFALVLLSALVALRPAAAGECEQPVRVLFQAEPLGSSPELLFGSVDEVEVLVPPDAPRARYTIGVAISAELEPCDVGIRGICLGRMTTCSGEQVTCRGIQGWVLPIALDGDLRLVEVDADEANPAIACSPLFRVASLIDPEQPDADGEPQGQGAITAVVFFCGDAASLNPHGTETVLSLTLEAERPAEGEVIEGRLSCRSGLALPGAPPSAPSVTVDGESFPFCECPEVVVRFRAEPQGAFVRCDVDESGRLEVADVVALLEWLFRGGAEPACVPLADCDADRRVTVSDAAYAILHLFGDVASPPAPYPGCGVSDDPTERCDSGSDACAVARAAG